jgi:hypothetical protein
MKALSFTYAGYAFPNSGLESGIRRNMQMNRKRSDREKPAIDAAPYGTEVTRIKLKLQRVQMKAPVSKLIMIGRAVCVTRCGASHLMPNCKA